MAMVTAYKNGKSIKVSRSAYENVFKKQGYREEKKKYSGEPDWGTGMEVETETNAEVDLDTIPISDMTKEQLMQFAKKHNIDTKGAKNVTDARRIIQSYMRKKAEQA